MYTRASQQQLQALARLAQSPDGEVFLALLDTELGRLTSNLLESSGDITLKLQGAARATKDVISMLREAPELSKKPR